LKTRRSVLLGSVLALALGVLTPALLMVMALGTTGCSLSEAKEKAALLAALTEFKAKSTPLGLMVVSTDQEATVTSDGTPVSVAIKEGLGALADEWQSVVEKAKKVEGADAERAEKIWSDLQTAVAGVPEGATAGEAGALIGVPLQNLMAMSSELTDIATSLD
jgi:hypothetical protein